MKTPAGDECRFYYEDYHRGHSQQTCRLIQANRRSAEWRPTDCGSCPVPGILQANGSPDLVLEGSVKSGFLGFARRIVVEAFCNRHSAEVPNPHVGCAQCAQEKPGWRELLGGE